MATFRTHPSDVKDYNPAAKQWAEKLQGMARAASGKNLMGAAQSNGGDGDGLLLGKTTERISKTSGTLKPRDY